MMHNRAGTVHGLKKLTIVLVALLSGAVAKAQPEIPIGTWRLHLSYNAIKNLTTGNNHVFAATESGVITFDLAEQSIDTYNTINGLTETGISCLGFDEERKQLLVGYATGNIDIIADNETLNFRRIKNTTSIPGSKRINHISIRNDLAYFSTDFGIVVFDLERNELKETWRDLGPGGTTVAVFETAFLVDSIFAATSAGIIAGKLNDNLLDFSFWNRFSGEEFEGAVKLVENFMGKIFIAVDGVGLFEKSGIHWIRNEILQGTDFNSLNSTENTLLITTPEGVWSMNQSGVPTTIESEAITSPSDALMDLNGNLWIGDLENGLISNASGSFISYLPNGPAMESVFRLESLDNKLYAIHGGFNENTQPLNRKGTLSYFEDGAWSTIQKEFIDLTDVALQDGALFTASFRNGLERAFQNNATFYNGYNSPLASADGQNVSVTAIEPSTNGLWVLNYGVDQSLHRLQGDSWESFALPSPYVTDAVVDLSGNPWMVGDPKRNGGLVVFDLSTGNAAHKTTTNGNGALPNINVHSIDVDRNGRVWVGTENGVAYFFDQESDAIRPIFENRFLLQSEKITAIKTDGGNRKWIASGTGVWLFNPEGDELVTHFNTGNSPLLSNNVLDIEINDQTGEVFFATDKGIVSYRSDATQSESVFKHIKIFPNPVTSAFSGLVGIEGLATDAVVKITDVSGKLIWQTKAHGGTATWNVRDINGKRAATGIYVVYATAEDGSDSIVGKIAVVD